MGRRVHLTSLITVLINQLVHLIQFIGGMVEEYQPAVCHEISPYLDN